jgi:Arc/MetJ family transcription regulator
MHMRTTLDLDDELLLRARAYSPELTKTALLEEELRELIKTRAARHLAAARGTQPALDLPPRRRP